MKQKEIDFYNDMSMIAELYLLKITFHASWQCNIWYNLQQVFFRNSLRHESAYNTVSFQLSQILKNHDSLL